MGRCRALPSNPVRPARRARREIHLVNPLWDPTGGADLRTVDLYELLCRRTIRCGCGASTGSIRRSGHLDVSTIRPWRHPRDGTVVLVGVYFRNGGWIRRTDARRIVVIYNTDQPDRLQKTLQRIGERPVQIVYTSDALRDATRRDPRLDCARPPVARARAWCSRASSSRRASTRSSTRRRGTARRRAAAASRSGGCRATTRASITRAIRRSSRRSPIAGCASA